MRPCTHGLTLKECRPCRLEYTREWHRQQAQSKISVYRELATKQWRPDRYVQQRESNDAG